MRHQFYKRILRYGIYLVLLTTLQSYGQDRCGIIEVTEKLRNRNILRESDTHFEDWMSVRKRIAEARTQATGTYRIPVVVHVIHRGEAVGTTTNISDAQIVSQIAVLNQDFNRLNTDASNTPVEFQSVAGSLDIEFVLAEQTPDGLPTNGIVRVKGTKNQWSANDDETLKAQSYWPAEDYLNIWVTDLTSTLLGYAQFPVSDIPGLEDAEDNRLTDGVVVDYTVFGSRDAGSFNLNSSFNKGRTATHEIGHFFGLRHIWGDDNGACGGNNDYVSDTPDQGDNSSGCPSNPQTSCSVHTMFQNYMDYTNDACMNLFTQEQVDRMITVLDNSPRRASLMDSPGLNEIYANDLGIVSILAPGQSVCEGPFLPAIRIKNLGTNNVTNARIQLVINNTVAETRTITFPSPLAITDTADVSFGSIPVTDPGTYAIEFNIQLVNGAADDGTQNNKSTVTTIVPSRIILPFSESFESIPSSWQVTNPDIATTWNIKTATKESQSNTSSFINFFQYNEAEGQTDLLTTPVFDLSAATSPYLYFDVAYANRASLADGLKVYVLTSCESDVANGTQVYSKSGSTLATTSARTSAFTPAGEDDWRREIVDLSAFIGQSRIQLAFVAINDNGNNLYVDNITVVSEVYENVAVTRLVSPSPVVCDGNVTPSVLIKNAGDEPVTSLTIQYTTNGGSPQELALDEDFFLLPGGDTTITLNQMLLEEGENTLSFELKKPNGVRDVDESDNTLIVTRIVNTASDGIPLREMFDDDAYKSSWSTVNSGVGSSWQEITTNYNNSLYFTSVEDSVVQDEAWLVSPVLDFSAVDAASVFFDLSYGSAGDTNKSAFGDRFKVLATTDCGSTYSLVLLDGAGETGNEPTGSVPSSADDWNRLFVNLSALAGYDQVRLAFVFQNGSGGSIYLDNIEFFTSDDPSPLQVNEPFVIYGTDLQSPSDFLVTFNLEQRQDVMYTLVDMTGRTIVTENLPDVLNQTYQVNADRVSSGIYIMRVRIGDKFYSERVYIGH